MSRRHLLFAAVTALTFLVSGGVSAGEVRHVQEPDGSLRITNRPRGSDQGPAKKVRDPDGALRLVLRGGVTCTPQADKGQYDAFFADAAERHGLSVSLLKAVARVESAFDPQAVSKAGARGLMQLMPQTAEELGVGDPHDPAQAIDGGARYLRQMIDRFGELRLAVAAYNAGPDAVTRYAGIPPFEETQRYVVRVLGWYEEALQPGLEPRTT